MSTTASPGALLFLLQLERLHLRMTIFSTSLEAASLAAVLLAVPARAENSPMSFSDAQYAANAGKSGVCVRETETEALITRAWLAENAQTSIEVEYSIWSTDNIGILAAETLLRGPRGARDRDLLPIFRTSVKLLSPR